MKRMSKSERINTIVQIIFYIIYVIIGILLLKYPEIEVLKPIEYATPLFYILGFFSIICYFVKRIPDDYELLFVGLINIFVGSYIMFYSYFDNTGFILGNALLIYLIANILNKGWHTIKLSRQNDIKMFPKFAITILLSLLGFLVITNLYKDVTMQTLILGYYFLCYGFLSMVEPIMLIIIKNRKIEKYLIDLLEDNYEKEVKKLPKEVKTENINKKEHKFNNVLNTETKLKDVKVNKTKDIKQSNKKKEVIKQPKKNNKKVVK